MKHYLIAFILSGYFIYSLTPITENENVVKPIENAAIVPPLFVAQVENVKSTFSLSGLRKVVTDIGASQNSASA
jgi:predicted transcriptional regulator